MQSIPKTESEIAQLTEQGLKQQNAGEFAAASLTFKRIIELDPANVVAHYSMGYIYAKREDFAAALPHLNKVVTLRPDFAQGREALAIAMQQLGKTGNQSSGDSAIMPRTIQTGLKTKSKLPGQKTNSPNPRTIVNVMEDAQALQQQGQSDKALDLYIEFLKECDDDVRYIAQYNASVLLIELKRDDQVRALLEEAIAEKPDFYQGYLALGTFLEKIGQPAEAIQMWESALLSPLIHDPVHIEIHCQLLTNIGRVHELQRNYAGAEEAMKRSLDINPQQGPVLHHWLHLRQKQCKWPSSYGLKLTHDEIVKHASPMTMLSISDDPAAQLEAAKTFVREKVGTFPRMVKANKRYKHDRLRIGYLSSDLSMHAVSLLTVELFETHDRDKVEVHAFCWSKEDGTAFRERVKNAFDHFHVIGGMDDEAAAKLIKAQEIDVLVDLQGLTSGARPNILARGPAPIQVSWLGFPGPCAIPYVDYVVADTFIFPEELKPHFKEQPLYLDTLFQVSDSKREVGPTPSRGSLGIPEDKFVFCAFNNNYKITPDIFASWMRILRGAPDSVLWLLEDNAWSRENLLRAAGVHGVNPDRLYFAGRILPSEYLARFKAADLFLDTTPYNAGTTANDALWAGLPLLTLSGKSYVSRMAGSLLRSAGLDELITFSHADYETKAIELAKDPRRVKPFKMSLREQRESGTLFSTKRFCREFESALLGFVDSKMTVATATPEAKAASKGVNDPIHLYHIAYSQETFASVPPGFKILDNTSGERNDWREYWPIRNFLLNEKLSEDAYYGFFSPRFGEKTGLDYAKACAFVESAGIDTDVVTFSPQADMGAFFLNVFEQEELFDPGFTATSEAFFSAIGMPLDLKTIVMDSRQIIFSNYFVARPKFWRAWLEMNEKLFVICEGETSELKELAVHETSYPGAVQRKVFLMERIASVLLATNEDWKSKAYDPFSLAWSASRLNEFKTEAAISDALKIAIRNQNFKIYQYAYSEVRNRLRNS